MGILCNCSLFLFVLLLCLFLQSASIRHNSGTATQNDRSSINDIRNTQFSKTHRIIERGSISSYLAHLNRKRRHDALASNDTVVADAVMLKLMEMLDPSTDAQLLSLLKRWVPLCRTELEVDMNKKSTVVKYIPYSVVDEALRFAQEVKGYNAVDKIYEEKCETLPEFQESIQRGEVMCLYKLLSPIEICRAFDQYAYVIWVGNSLTRHVLNALHMLLSEDLQEGGIPMSSRREHFDNRACQCDHQFSEAEVCRDYKQPLLAKLLVEKCKKILPSSSIKFTFHFYEIHSQYLKHISQDDSRPILVLFQGRHDRFNYINASTAERWKVARESVNLLVDQRLNTLQDNNVTTTVNKTTQRKVHGVIVGEGVQSRYMDAKYIHQSRENVHIMNNLFQQILRENIRYENITFLDIYNFTLETPGVFVENSHHVPSPKTSDGFHYWAGVNIGKANAIAHLMALVIRHQLLLTAN